ncbi:glycosyltransferase [Agromyces aerolatus]|uniref:glycosyltransferase n=1 Tax=Agromyces sp. LY-1074 TaxID=3074080 RepID=UPI00285BABB9|nr:MULTISPECIES: glycosyltransferase [unclassified Agromyces]MDR5700357.1 glycosyltransferase [Agromyces sp. LY-1074]MDR5706665.1 glycosyltransferase [Agromyces sp. LY-1358]
MRQKFLRIIRVVLRGRYDDVRSRVLGQPKPTSDAERAQRLLDLGVFDPEFYRASAHVDATDRLDLALHFVTDGSHFGYSPHPLIELDYFPTEVRHAVERGETDGLVAHVQSDWAREHAWGPLFDPREFAIAEPPADALRHLHPNAPLPVPNGFEGPIPTWKQARARAIEHAVAISKQRMYRTAVADPDWDAEGEAAWIAEISAHPLATEAGAPLVSIVMPVWNRVDTVGEAIESVLAQSLAEWELLVVDDGSTDGSIETVRRYAADDPRIQLIERQHVGVCAARNAGIEAAQGELVAFLDSDNAWTPQFLELSAKAMRSGGHAAVYSAVELIDHGGTSTYRGLQVERSDLLIENSIDMNCLVTTTEAIRAIDGFDTSLRRWVDHDLVLRLAAAVTLTYLPFIGCRYSHNDRLDRITIRESSHWQFVVLGNALLDWDQVLTDVDSRVPGRVSVVVLAYQDHHRTVRAIDSVLRTTGDEVEIVVVDNGSRHAVGRSLDARYGEHPRVAYHRLARNYNFATGSNVGFARSSGEFVMFLNNDTEVREGWLEPLVERLTRREAFAVQPLMTYPNGTVQTAGTVFTVPDGLASHFLARHPVQDALRHDGMGFHAVTAGAMLTRAADFARLKGFDPIYANGLEDVDFCLRAGAAFGGTFEVESRSVVVHEESQSPGRFAREGENRRLFLQRWRGRLPRPQVDQFAKLSFEVVHLSPEVDVEYGMARPLLARSTTPAPGATTPSLRWAIKIGADNSPAGDLWGDVPFADELARALGAAGQDAVIDRFGAFGRPTSYLDDVVLTIRGRHPVHPQAGRTNVLWVISRPELVDVAEVQAYDLVFSASPKWAEWMSKASGRRVDVLLQASDPSRFAWQDDAARGPEALFVGGPRPGAGRRIVSDAVAADLPLAVWGPGWPSYVPGDLVKGEFLHWADVPGAYRAADVVLNDHLEGMSQWGFISNRIFDAVASGAAVITDEVDGLEMFGGSVVSYSSPDELRALFEDRSWRPSEERRRELSAQMHREHSFEARATTLLDAVLAHRAELGFPG